MCQPMGSSAELHLTASQSYHTTSHLPGLGNMCCLLAYTIDYISMQEVIYWEKFKQGFIETLIFTILYDSPYTVHIDSYNRTEYKFMVH